MTITNSATTTRTGSAQAAFYVATTGNGDWSGTLPDPNPEGNDGPFATLERARDAIRTLKQAGPLPVGGLTVWIRSGAYPLAATFELTAEDSGTPEAPIVYRAYQDEKVQLSGSVAIPAAAFEPVSDPAIVARIDNTAHGKVLQVDLKAQGISDYGEVAQPGKRMELFFQDRPMTLARWPNESFAHIADVMAEETFAIFGITGSRAPRFIYEGDRPARWRAEPDIWLFGYWFWDWAEEYMRVESIDTGQHLINLADPQHHYGYQAGQRFYALNLLAELDQPGEWYLDRDSGILYFWPPAPLDEGPVVVSMLEEPMITMADVSYVTVRNLLFECTRGTGVEVRGGTHNLIAGCTLRNIGTTAVRIDGGTEHGVVGCDIYEIGETGVSLSGGDRLTLTPGEHFASNNHIHHYGQWKRTCRPAIQTSGVGNQLTHNLIHDAPHGAIMLSGNEHLIEFNEIYHICQETGDAGGFYMGRDWTERGNIIRYNFFHHISGPGSGGSRPVYLDDWASGTTVLGNVFYQAGRAVFIGGGRDNIVDNNIFVDCSPSVYVDARGKGWASSSFDGTNTVLVDRMEAVNYRQLPYSTRYPELLTLYDDDPAEPKGNVIVRNVCVRGTWLDMAGIDRAAGVLLDLPPVNPESVTIQDNLVTDDDPGFVDAENMNFQFRADSPVHQQIPGFQQIPFDQIGLYRDEYRTALHRSDS